MLLYNNVVLQLLKPGNFQVHFLLPVLLVTTSVTGFLELQRYLFHFTQSHSAITLACIFLSFFFGLHFFSGKVGVHGGVFRWLLQCACWPHLFLPSNLLQWRMDHCARYIKSYYSIRTNYNINHSHFFLENSIQNLHLV